MLHKILRIFALKILLNAHTWLEENWLCPVSYRRRTLPFIKWFKSYFFFDKEMVWRWMIKRWSAAWVLPLRSEKFELPWSFQIQLIKYPWVTEKDDLCFLLSFLNSLPCLCKICVLFRWTFYIWCSFFIFVEKCGFLKYISVKMLCNNIYPLKWFYEILGLENTLKSTHTQLDLCLNLGRGS